MTQRSRAAYLTTALLVLATGLRHSAMAETVTSQPFIGITHITRTETTPRAVNMHIVVIDLTAPGLSFKLTPPGGSRETVRQTTLEFLNQQQAQVAINSHFFLPHPSTDAEAWLVGFAASQGQVYSSFESPTQSFAIVANAPAINIDAENHASIVHCDTTIADGKHVKENVTLWNAVAGSAQIITDGVKTIPTYAAAAGDRGLLTADATYSNAHSWYSLPKARTAIGLSQDNKTLLLFTVDAAGGSGGMTPGEVADVLITDYKIYNALNLDGGGSTTLAMEDPLTHTRSIVNVSADNPKGRPVGSNLAVFARPAQGEGK